MALNAEGHDPTEQLKREALAARGRNIQGQGWGRRAVRVLLQGPGGKGAFPHSLALHRAFVETESHPPSSYCHPRVACPGHSQEHS